MPKKEFALPVLFGGLHSGVTDKTKEHIFGKCLVQSDRYSQTSFRHGLRTDAATRFEKNIDISNTVTVLKRASSYDQRAWWWSNCI